MIPLLKNGKRRPPVQHGKGKSKEYAAWAALFRRCYDKNNPFYHRYGGRGIKVCMRWHQFMNFYNDMGPRPDGLSLDRIDNDKGYSKSNCRWATQSEQLNNTARNRRITFNGITLTHKQWCEKNGWGYWVVYNRIKLGWLPQDAVSTGLHKGRPL